MFPPSNFEDQTIHEQPYVSELEKKNCFVILRLHTITYYLGNSDFGFFGGPYWQRWVISHNLLLELPYNKALRLIFNIQSHTIKFRDFKMHPIM